VIYEFSDFRLDTRERTLSRAGTPVSLAPKVFDTLVTLVERSGSLVTKDELMDELWPDSHVGDDALARNISDLRRALGDTARKPTFVETVPKSGYRFVGSVRAISSSPSESSLRATRQGNGRALLAVVAVVAVVAALVGYANWPATPPPEIRSLAVLPFEVIGVTAEGEYLGIGMADALITNLGGNAEVVVRPTSSVMRYAEGADATHAATELQVDALVTGLIQRNGEEVRVSAQLVAAADRTTLWADSFDERFVNVLTLQDSISGQVVDALRLHFALQERGLAATRYAASPAYPHYIRGRFFWNKRTREGYLAALEHYERALELDSSFAPAYVGISDCYLFGAGGGLSAREAFGRAREMAHRALELDPQLAEAHASLALNRHIAQWDFEGAEEEFERAIRLGPNYASALQWYADLLGVLGRHDEALARLREAQRIDPVSMMVARDVGRSHYFARDFDRAIEKFHETLEMDREFVPALFYLGFAYERAGNVEEAVATFRRVVELDRRPLMRAALAYGLARASKTEEAERILEEMVASSAGSSRMPSLDIAMIYVGLGRTDEAFEWLENAVSSRSYRVVYLGADPIFDEMRSDPRFSALLSRIGLAEEGRDVAARNSSRQAQASTN
jgi:DNA-binding winged helix-turn-helix (wHTH) protein/TolB-like protein/tetratricopeptide (TPR) repeat protein